MSKLKIKILFLSLIIFFACSREVSELEYGIDQCVHCKMILTDQKYGALIYTDRGRSVKFDAVECMLDYVKKGMISENEINNYYVVHITDKGLLKDAMTSVYLISPGLRSPMGKNISAFANSEDAGKYMEKYGGEVLSWNDLRERYLK